MAHFLVADDVEKIRRNVCSWLDEDGHTSIEASHPFAIQQAILHSEQPNNEPFDLIILDHDLGDLTGLKVISYLSRAMHPDYFRNRFVVMTGHVGLELPKEYCRRGSIGHLVKPVHIEQFRGTIGRALEQRSLLIDKPDDWEQAIELLTRQELLPDIESIYKENQELNSQLEHLKAINAQLIASLQFAGKEEEQRAAAFDQAEKGLLDVGGESTVILPFLEGYELTESFQADVEDLFNSNRIRFFVLMNTLRKVRAYPGYPRTKLEGLGRGYYEYRVGREYRLYFHQDGTIQTLLRITHRRDQKRTIESIRNSKAA
jgi:CheY-like chemotaxis protein